MKRHIIVLLLAMVALPLAGREVYDINRGWKFFRGSAVSSDGATTVDLPHTWNLDALAGDPNYFRGECNYTREIAAPASWSGKRVFIKCYGANSVADIFVNGRHVGTHCGGYTAFAFEITGSLRFGQRNFLRIIVNNAPRFDVLPTAGDANSYGGLFRSVEIVVAEPTMIALTDNASDGIYIRQMKVGRDRVEAQAVVKVSGAKGAGVQASLSLVTAEGDTVATADTKVRLDGGAFSTVTIPFALEKPRLWNGTKDPYLYKVCVSISENGRVLDEVAVTTGFRYFRVENGKGFILNGEPYRLNGVSVSQDRAGVGNAVVVSQVAEDVELIREMGANAVRVAGVTHHPAFYELCDRYGIVVWSDFPLVGATSLTDIPFVDSKAFRRNGISQAKEIIYQQYNHPSVVMWGLFSNLKMRGDSPVNYVSQLDSLAKKEDPSRLTVASSNEDGEINFIPDLISWDHHFGWLEGMPSDINIWSEQLHRNWSALRSGLSYSAGGSIRHQDDSLLRPDPAGVRHPERWQTYLHEEYWRNVGVDSLFWSVFAGNMFDYGATRYLGGEGKGVNDSGLVAFDRRVRKDAFYFYKANWNTSQHFVYIPERRWDNRNRPVQRIKVYSNCPEVELFVNGESKGTTAGNLGTFVWEDVELRPGSNIIEARSGDCSDLVKINVSVRSGQMTI